ncbi:MAG: tRNA 2-thiouridine(34) synthase MnmA [Candidatus Gracilibacteria bacterium]
MRKPKVIVGMSGGVDSSMAMYLLIHKGYEPIGVSLKYEVWDDPANTLKENVCCSDESFQIAKHVCEKLGAKHYILDVGKKFKKEIVEYFKAELAAKRTPNPCVICNRVLKFKELLNFAKKHHAKFIATGHYARIVKSKKLLPEEKKDTKNRTRQRSQEYSLAQSADPKKDQTYSLSFLKKEWLPRILFPLGTYTKDKVFEMAKEAGFGFYLYRKQSQDFCYVSDKSMKAFLEKEIGIEPGNIVDSQGKILGRHRGLHFYTIGQRKGVEIPNGPWFVVGMNVGKNELIVTKLGTSPACPALDGSLFKKELILNPCNLLIKPFKKPIQVEAKIRYGQEASKATLYCHSRPDRESGHSRAVCHSSTVCHSRLDRESGHSRTASGGINSSGNFCTKDTLKLVFATPQRAVTLGQFAVFYKGKKCLGSGRIMQTN